MAANDCFRMRARLDGACTECREPIRAGDWIVWDPEERKAYCGDCGEEILPQRRLQP